MYVYIRSEPGLYTVGFYDPSGKWHAESDHEDREQAAARVATLNGGGRSEPIALTLCPRCGGDKIVAGDGEPYRCPDCLGVGGVRIIPPKQ
jgi:hypothetical protein